MLNKRCALPDILRLSVCRYIEEAPTSFSFLPAGLLSLHVNFFLYFGLLIELVEVVHYDGDGERDAEDSTNGTTWKQRSIYCSDIDDTEYEDGDGIILITNSIILMTLMGGKWL